MATGIIDADLHDGYGLILSFTDGTTARYVVEELLALRPHREPTIPPRQPAEPSDAPPNSA